MINQDPQTPVISFDRNPFMNANNSNNSSCGQPRPPSIVLRSSAKQLTSTTSTAAYCPVQSNQFNASISKQPVAAIQHRNSQNQINDHLGQPGITLVSNSPNMSIRSIPPSSRVLIRPSSSVSNFKEHRLSNPQIVRKTQINAKVGGQYVNNMLNAMKIQLEQMNINFSNRLSQQIQKQNEQIQKLQKTLKENQILIKTKDQDIEKLREIIRLGNLNKDKECKLLQLAIEQNHEYLSGKIRDVRTKIMVVADQLFSMKPKDESKQYQLLLRIKQMQKNLNCIVCNEFNIVKEGLVRISDSSLNLITNVEKKVEIINQSANQLVFPMNSLQNSNRRMNQYSQKLNELTRNVSQMSANSNTLNSQQIQQFVSGLEQKFFKLQNKIQFVKTEVEQKIIQKSHLQEEYRMLYDRFLSGQKNIQTKNRQIGAKHRQAEILSIQSYNKTNQLQILSKKLQNKQTEIKIKEDQLLKKQKQYEVKSKQLALGANQLEIRNKQIEVRQNQLDLRIKKTKETQKYYKQKITQLNSHIQQYQRQTLEAKRLTQSSSRAKSYLAETTSQHQVLQKIPSTQSIQSLNVSTSSHRSKVQIIYNYSEISGSMKKNNNTYSMKNLNYREEKPSPKLSAKLLNLENLLKKSGKKLPLRCEIDEAGILKEYEEGTYLFNDDGDVFTLNETDKLLAIKHKLIYL